MSKNYAEGICTACGTEPCAEHALPTREQMAVTLDALSDIQPEREAAALMAGAAALRHPDLEALKVAFLTGFYHALENIDHSGDYNGQPQEEVFAEWAAALCVAPAPPDAITPEEAQHVIDTHFGPAPIVALTADTGAKEPILALIPPAAPAVDEVGQELARRADQLGLLSARGAREGNVPDEVFFRETAFWVRRALDEILRQRRWIDDALAYESKMPALEDENRALRASLRAAPAPEGETLSREYRERALEWAESSGERKQLSELHGLTPHQVKTLVKLSNRDMEKARIFLKLDAPASPAPTHQPWCHFGRDAECECHRSPASPLTEPDEYKATPLTAEEAQRIIDAHLDSAMSDRKCIVCHKRPPAVPDRERIGRPIKRVCLECHAERLRRDASKILEAHLRGRRRHE
jgi:hypothetical protein